MAVNTAMTVLLVMLMAYRHMSNSAHELLGITFICLFFVHTYLNWHWYVTLGKGRYTIARTTCAVVNLGLLISFIGMVASSV